MSAKRCRPATTPGGNPDRNYDYGKLTGQEPADVVASTRTAVPRPRLVPLPGDPARARTRHRLAVARRHARMVRALDELLGVRQYVGTAEVVPIDYAAMWLDRGMPERVAAGRRWSA